MYDPRYPQGYNTQGTYDRTYGQYPPGQAYNDRVFYSSPQGTQRFEKEVYVEHYKPKIGPCMWIMAILLLLFVIGLIICLIIFFTWGNAYTGGPGATTGEGGSKQSDKGNVLWFDALMPRNVRNHLQTGNDKICLLDTAFLKPNYAQSFNDEHIPDALHFDIAKVSGQRKEDGSLLLLSPLEFQKYVRSLGIDKDCQVVLYDHSEAPNSIVTATYAWYLFKLYGHKKATVMNGGLKAWKKEMENDPKYKPVSGSAKSKKEGDFEASWDAKRFVSYEDLKKDVEKNNAQLADSRKPDDFRGTTKAPEAKEGGRIKGATNAPTEEMLNSDGALKILPDLKSWLSSKKLDLSRLTYVYDNNSLFASALYFVLDQAGWNVKMYDSGWIEWSYKAPSELKERGA